MLKCECSDLMAIRVNAILERAIFSPTHRLPDELFTPVRCAHCLGLEARVLELEIAVMHGAEMVEALTPRPVVAAVIEDRNGNYIIGQRRADQWMPNKWCFVGGKVENGETLEDALKREVMEEIGIAVEVGDLVHHQLEKYEHGTFALNYFHCYCDEAPKAIEVAEVLAVDPRFLQDYDLLPVDIDIARRIADKKRIAQLEARNAELEQQREQVREREIRSHARNAKRL